MEKRFKLISISFFALSLVVFFSQNTCALNLNSKSIKGLSKSYGFLLGQEFTLSKVEQTFLELKLYCELAKSNFNATFPQAKQKIEAQLIKVMGKQKFYTFKKDFTNQLHHILSQQNINKQNAIQFLELMNRRAKGDIEQPMLGYLLAVQYEFSPAQEFADGFKKRFLSAGHSKSYGVKLGLQLPVSWAEKEGNRPHIVKKWISENGTGLESIALGIRNMGFRFDNRYEIEELVKSGEAKEWAPKGSTCLNFGNFRLENQTGLWLEITMTEERVGINVYQHALMSHIFFRDKIISIFCSAGGPPNRKKSIERTFQKLVPLCRQVLNSMVLYQVY